ncbi:MAG: ATP phosphoribosyltransferase regulatory subunit [Acidobacteriota bacterium]
MRISAALPPGVTALLFDAAARRRRIEGRCLERLEEAGFSEVILPILDYLEPYEPILTEATRGELYRFIGRDGDQLAIRSDFTPMLARLLAPRLAALDGPLRLYYRGDVVRYGDIGREREQYHLGAELLGVPGEAGEVEMLRLFLALASEVEAPRVVLGFAGALDELLRRVLKETPEEAERRSVEELLHALRRRERRPLRLAHRSLLEIAEHGVPADPATLGTPAAERLAALAELVEELHGEFPAVSFEIDFAEFAHHTLDADLEDGVRDRTYYDGLVFRVYAAGSGRSCGSGGRYDRLFRGLGAEVPAVGFSFGLDRLAEALP